MTRTSDGRVERDMTDEEIAEIQALFAEQPEPTPNIISDRQFFQQLAIEGRITENEALDAVGPAIIPSAMLALIIMLPDEDRFGAKMLIRGATTFERLHPVAGLIQQLYGWTDAKRDDFWLAASKL